MTTFSTVSMDGLDIFYREAGSRDNPTILLLQFYLFDTGHFALEEDGEASCASPVGDATRTQQRFSTRRNAIAKYIRQFLTSRLQPISA